MFRLGDLFPLGGLFLLHLRGLFLPLAAAVGNSTRIVAMNHGRSASVDEDDSYLELDADASGIEAPKKKIFDFGGMKKLVAVKMRMGSDVDNCVQVVEF